MSAMKPKPKPKPPGRRARGPVRLRLVGKNPKELDPGEVHAMLIEADGDVHSVARRFGCDTETLRTHIYLTPGLRSALDEVMARAVDKSVQVLSRCLDDDSASVRMSAAREFLKSRAAQRRGFHQSADLEVRMGRQKASLSLTWLAPETKEEIPGSSPGTRLIEGRVVDE